MRRLAAALALALLASALSFAQGGMAKENDDSMSNDAMKPTTDRMRPLVEYTDLEDAQMLAAQGPTVLFFWASWCPTCRAAMRELEKDGERLGEITVVIVDYDRETELKRAYGITYQHSWVQIDAGGRKLAAWSGGGIDGILGHVAGM